jgi:hypothetical protein
LLNANHAAVGEMVGLAAGIQVVGEDHASLLWTSLKVEIEKTCEETERGKRQRKNEPSCRDGCEAQATLQTLTSMSRSWCRH